MICQMKVQDAEFNAFAEAVIADKTLQDKLITAKDYESIIKIASDAGYEFSLACLIRNQAVGILSLSDDELLEISGGKLKQNAKIGIGAGIGAGGGFGIGAVVFAVITCIK